MVSLRWRRCVSRQAEGKGEGKTALAEVARNDHGAAGSGGYGRHRHGRRAARPRCRHRSRSVRRQVRHGRRRQGSAADRRKGCRHDDVATARRGCAEHSRRDRGVFRQDEAGWPRAARICGACQCRQSSAPCNRSNEAGGEYAGPRCRHGRPDVRQGRARHGWRGRRGSVRRSHAQDAGRVPAGASKALQGRGVPRLRAAAI